MGIITFIIGALLGALAGFAYARGSAKGSGSLDLQDKSPTTRSKPLVELKQENLKKLETIIKDMPQITNDAVEKELGVSDATATRYLDELERRKIVRQIGKTGKFVYYEKI